MSHRALAAHADKACLCQSGEGRQRSHAPAPQERHARLRCLLALALLRQADDLTSQVPHRECIGDTRSSLPLQCLAASLPSLMCCGSATCASAASLPSLSCVQASSLVSQVSHRAFAAHAGKARLSQSSEGQQRSHAPAPQERHARLRCLLALALLRQADDLTSQVPHRECIGDTRSSLPLQCLAASLPSLMCCGSATCASAASLPSLSCVQASSLVSQVSHRAFAAHADKACLCQSGEGRQRSHAPAPQERHARLRCLLALALLRQADDLTSQVPHRECIGDTRSSLPLQCLAASLPSLMCCGSATCASAASLPSLSCVQASSLVSQVSHRAFAAHAGKARLSQSSEGQQRSHAPAPQERHARLRCLLALALLRQADDLTSQVPHRECIGDTRSSLPLQCLAASLPSLMCCGSATCASAASLPSLSCVQASSLVSQPVSQGICSTCRESTSQPVQ